MKKLRSERERAGLTQAELATKAGVGADTISRLESGHQAVRPGTLAKIAAALDIPKQRLVDDDEAQGRTIEVDDDVYKALMVHARGFGDTPNKVIRRLLMAEEDQLLVILRELRAFGFITGNSDADLRGTFAALIAEETRTGVENRHLQMARDVGILPRPRDSERGAIFRVLSHAARFFESVESGVKLRKAAEVVGLSSTTPLEELQERLYQWISEERATRRANSSLAKLRAWGFLPSRSMTDSDLD